VHDKVHIKIADIKWRNGAKGWTIFPGLAFVVLPAKSISDYYPSFEKLQGEYRG